MSEIAMPALFTAAAGIMSPSDTGSVTAVQEDAAGSVFGQLLSGMMGNKVSSDTVSGEALILTDAADGIKSDKPASILDIFLTLAAPASGSTANADVKSTAHEADMFSAEGAQAFLETLKKLVSVSGIGAEEIQTLWNAVSCEEMQIYSKLASEIAEICGEKEAKADVSDEKTDKDGSDNSGVIVSSVGEMAVYSEMMSAVSHFIVRRESDGADLSSVTDGSGPIIAEEPVFADREAYSAKVSGAEALKPEYKKAFDSAEIETEDPSEASGEDPADNFVSERDVINTVVLAAAEIAAKEDTTVLTGAEEIISDDFGMANQLSEESEKADGAVLYAAASGMAEQLVSDSVIGETGEAAEEIGTVSTKTAVNSIPAAEETGIAYSADEAIGENEHDVAYRFNADKQSDTKAAEPAAVSVKAAGSEKPDVSEILEKLGNMSDGELKKAFGRLADELKAQVTSDSRTYAEAEQKPQLGEMLSSGRQAFMARVKGPFEPEAQEIPDIAGVIYRGSLPAEDISAGTLVPETNAPDITEQILEKINFYDEISQGSEKELTISLAPEELGKLKIKITGTDKGLVISFAAENSETAKIIGDRAAALAEAVASRGERLHEISVTDKMPVREGNNSAMEYSGRDSRSGNEAYGNPDMGTGGGANERRFLFSESGQLSEETEITADFDAEGEINYKREAKLWVSA